MWCYFLENDFKSKILKSINTQFFPPCTEWHQDRRSVRDIAARKWYGFLQYLGASNFIYSNLIHATTQCTSLHLPISIIQSHWNKLRLKYSFILVLHFAMCLKFLRPSTLKRSLHNIHGLFLWPPSLSGNEGSCFFVCNLSRHSCNNHI